jgi:pimeloyl-ACP methyl ester carboxylesterase
VRLALPYALKQTWADKSKVTHDVVEGFRRPLLAPGATEALWSMTASTTAMEPDWDALRATPVLVVKGDEDKWVTDVPLPKATTITYERCGHLPHEERAERFVADVLRFVTDVA